MTTTRVLSTAEAIAEYFRRFDAGDRAGALALFADRVDFDVAGAAFVPYTGQRSTGTEIEAFLTSALEDVTTEQFTIDRILVDGENAVVLGSLTHRVKATTTSYSSQFALHIAVTDGLIRLYRMFADSYAISQAFAA